LYSNWNNNNCAFTDKEILIQSDVELPDFSPVMDRLYYISSIYSRQGKPATSVAGVSLAMKQKN